MKIDKFENMKDYLKDYSFKWDRLPDNWQSGAFVGNGLLGTIFYRDANGNLYFELARTDFYDHRNRSYSLLFQNCRLPIGYLKLIVDEAYLVGNLELDMYNGIVKGIIKTPSARSEIKVYTHAEMDLIVIELEPVFGEPDYQFVYTPHICKSPRGVHEPQKIPSGYLPYPEQRQFIKDGINFAVQDMPEDKIYNTDGRGSAELSCGYKVVEENGKTYILCSLNYCYPYSDSTVGVADTINKAVSMDKTELENSHKKFWNDLFDNKAHISIPDKAIEQYYHMQTYKFASATRPGKPHFDLIGPWPKCDIVWPATWWNLNQQQTYCSIIADNMCDYINPVVDVLYNNRQGLIDNCELDRNDVYSLGRASGPELFEPTSATNECGNLAYVLNSIWQAYKANLDDKMLENKLLPLMCGALRYLLTLTYYADDKKLHIKPTSSPEYIGREGVEDCTYTISMLKWLASKIIYAYNRLEIRDSITEDCEKILRDIVDYNIGENGIMIGKNLPLSNSHSHWAHLYMVYPLYEYTFEDDNVKDLITKSFEYWASMKRDFAGYSYLGSSIMYSMMGKGNEALKNVNDYLDICAEKCPNTLYFDGRNVHISPVSETPVMLARAVQEMLLGAYNDAIRIFPAVPCEWKDVEFENMRAEGAFLVSARMCDSKIEKVEIKSLMGEKCVVKMTNLSHLKCNKEIVPIDESFSEIIISKGEIAIFE